MVGSLIFLVALRSPAFFVGALGSRRTHEKRRKRLVEKGMTEEELSRLYAPIGLAIGSRKPEEIAYLAVSIAGEDAGYITGQCLVANGGKYLL